MNEVDHRHIIAALTAEQRRDLTQRRDLPALARIAVHGGLIVLLATLVGAQIPLWPALLPPLGILIVFLFTLEHEAIHDTAFRTGWLNKTAAALAGFLILLPPNWFRYFHFAHHRHTHDPDNDPELMAPKPETVRQYVIYLSGWLYWSGMAKILATNALGRNRDVFVPDKGRAKIRKEARLFLFLYALLLALALALQSTVLVWTWVLPVLIGQPFLRAYLLAEHARCPHVANMLENTRTTFTTAVVRFVAWNMPFHAEHHSYPAVPFHSLPHFHRIVASHLRSTEHGYLRFHRKFAAGFEPKKHRPD